jgi:hypothetical protein
MLGTQVKNNTTTYKVILIAPPDNRNSINLEDLYAWVRPLNEPRHKGQSLWIGSTRLRTKMPPLNLTPLYNLPLHDLEIISSQQDIRHVRISFVPNLAVQEFLQKFMGHLHGPTSLTTDDGALQAKYHTSSQARYIVQSLIHFCKQTFDPNKWTAIPTWLTKRPQKQRPSISTWMISIRKLPIPSLHDLRYLPGNTHANP